MRTSVVISLVIFFNIISTVYGQDIFPDELPDVLPERFRVELDMDSVGYYSKHKREAKTNFNNSFLYISQFVKKDLFESGVIGYNYDVIETYLNNIVQKIISKEFIEKYNIHVYPCLETELNAYALHDGTILFNIHNFIYLKTEAEVAFILAHEVGHLIQEYHATEEWLKYMNSFDFFAGKKRKYEKASQSVEIDADYKAALMLTTSGYNNKAGLPVKLLFLRLETKLKNYKGNSSRRYVKTHPPSQERIDTAKVWTSSNNGNNYLVDSLLFYKIKKGARIHSIKNALKTNNYFQCLELAFEGYLSEGNPNYAYYIAESTRRLLYNKKASAYRNIFSFHYKNILATEFPHNIEKTIFLSKGQDGIMDMVKEKRIYNTQKFFDYFMTLSISQNETEAFLTKGLYDYTNSRGKNTDYLFKYIENNGKLKLFAEELIHPSESTNKKSLYVFNKVTAFTCSTKKPIKLFFLEKDLTYKFDSLSNNFYMEKCPVKNKEYKSIQTELSVSLKEAIFLENLSNLIGPSMRKKQSYTTLCPELGFYLLNNQYTTFQYADFVYQTCPNPLISKPLYLYKSLEYTRKKNKCSSEYKIHEGRLSLAKCRSKLHIGIAVKKSKYR